MLFLEDRPITCLFGALYFEKLVSECPVIPAGNGSRPASKSSAPSSHQDRRAGSQAVSINLDPKEERMALSPMKEKGTPLDRQMFTWQDLARTPISKLDDDAFTRVRVILMNGIESEALRFSHACARMNRTLSCHWPAYVGVDSISRRWSTGFFLPNSLRWRLRLV